MVPAVYRGNGPPAAKCWRVGGTERRFHARRISRHQTIRRLADYTGPPGAAHGNRGDLLLVRAELRTTGAAMKGTLDPKSEARSAPGLHQTRHPLRARNEWEEI